MTDKIVASIYFVFNNESKIPITLINNFDRGSVWVELESGDPEISKYGPDDGCSLVCKPYKVSKYVMNISYDYIVFVFVYSPTV